jgi:hypothetical protein
LCCCVKQVYSKTCRQGGGGENTSANADGGAETGKIKQNFAAMFGLVCWLVAHKHVK